MLYALHHHLDYVELPEVSLQSSGSQVSMERSGQLYAYRANTSSIYLGTRSGSEFGAAIGIGVVADGTYICIARNINESANVSIEINVRGK